MKHAIVNIYIKVEMPPLAPADMAAALTASAAGGLVEVFGEVRERILQRATLKLAAELRKQAAELEAKYPTGAGRAI